jgi:hypothetical protein
MLNRVCYQSPQGIYLISASALKSDRARLRLWGPRQVCQLSLCWNGKSNSNTPRFFKVLSAVGDISSLKALAVCRVDSIILNLRAVKSWIRRCKDNHLVCCKVVLGVKLLGINLIEGETNRIVQHPASDAEYLCLSYVWVDLSTQNVKIQNRELQDAPQTILDAVAYVKLLGKRYVWVDSIRFVVQMLW